MNVFRFFRTKKESPAQLSAQALEIIDQLVSLTPLFTVTSAGSEGAIMEAVNLFARARELDPENARLAFAHAATLKLAMQNSTALEELDRLARDNSHYSLVRFTQQSWHAGSPIAPAVFAYPEWNTDSTVLPEFYESRLQSAILYPAREGFSPAPVFFERDTENFWNEDNLQNVEIEFAIVIGSGSPTPAGIYRKCSGPGLHKPDIQESTVVLQIPKDDITLAGWKYLCGQDYILAVIVDANGKVLLNKKVALSEQAKNMTVKAEQIMLNSEGRELNAMEYMFAIQGFQNTVDLASIRF